MPCWSLAGVDMLARVSLCRALPPKLPVDRQDRWRRRNWCFSFRTLSIVGEATSHFTKSTA